MRLQLTALTIDFQAQLFSGPDRISPLGQAHRTTDLSRIKQLGQSAAKRLEENRIQSGYDIMMHRSNAMKRTTKTDIHCLC